MDFSFRAFWQTVDAFKANSLPLVSCVRALRDSLAKVLKKRRRRPISRIGGAVGNGYREEKYQSIVSRRSENRCRFWGCMMTRDLQLIVFKSLLFDSAGGADGKDLFGGRKA